MVCMSSEWADLSLGERLRICRERAGLTQDGAAKLLEVTQATISRYECGHRTPRLLWLRAMASIYDVTLDELVPPAEAA